MIYFRGALVPPLVKRLLSVTPCLLTEVCETIVGECARKGGVTGKGSKEH